MVRDIKFNGSALKREINDKTEKEFFQKSFQD